MARFSCWPAVLVILTFAACGAKSEPQPAANVPTESKPEPKDPPKEEPKPEPKPEPKEEPKPAADVGEAPAGDSSIPKTIKDEPTLLVTATPGTIVRDPKPDSPEWLVQQVLVAAMDPDEAKGWALFESLLHEDHKLELAQRRSMNFAASRRKVKLFLIEDPTKPIYQVDRVVEESPTRVRIFVHNNSEDGMPTPCELRMEEASKKWRVGICSL